MQKEIKDLTIGSKFVITGYKKEGAKYHQKLLAMGLTRGTKVELLKCAPLGDPVELLLRGFKLSLRKEEANILLFKGECDV